MTFDIGIGGPGCKTTAALEDVEGSSSAWVDEDVEIAGVDINLFGLGRDESGWSETQSSLSYQFRMAQNTISGIIPAVCVAIYHHLGSEIQVPESGNEWKMVAEEFWAKWNFPLCLGAMDGKHIRIKPPSHSGATYRNYKRFFSTALVDANLKFLYVDGGTKGRVSDGDFDSYVMIVYTVI
ncbi:DDE Tnp4 domain-containing protein [Trichonephila clavipes]|nr:DDE Tnp4 domain-containing protein [Trichonephila clavipes]